jgi:hypothetical protein
MTIKTQGGKVITKDGKVSCTCCAEPGECCMYPSQALFDGLYTYEDLPDTLFDAINNVFFTKLSSPQTGTGAGAPGVPTTYFLGTDSNNFTVGIGIYSNDDEGPNSGPIWRGSEVANEGEQYGACLFAPKFNDPLDYFRLEDQFADTYTIQFYGTPPDGPFIGTTTATRVSLCRWEFTAIGGTCGAGQTGALIYENNFLPEARFWRIVIGSCEGDEESIDNTTPLGTYLSADGEWRVV